MDSRLPPEWVSKVIKYHELDVGFILRASTPEIARQIKDVIRNGMPQVEFKKLEFVFQDTKPYDFDRTGLSEEQIQKKIDKRRRKREEKARLEHEERCRQLEAEHVKQREEESFDLLLLKEERQLYGLKLG